MGDEIDVSVVLAIYNETGHVRDEVVRIRRALEISRYTFEIVVVDDGSSDDSLGELADLPDLRVIRFSTNQGSGAARRVGTRAATGRIVVWTDVDMSYPNEEIPRLVRELEGHDQVVGARRSEQGSYKVLRVPAKWAIRKLASFLLDTPIPDLNSGFRAFRRDVAAQFLHLVPQGFSNVSTITMTFLANGYSVRYIDIEYKPRAGKSKFRAWRDTKSYLAQVIRMILSYNPLRVFAPIGTVLAIIGAGKLAYDGIERDLHVATSTLLVLFAAFQTFAIGLLADLVVRVTRPALRVDPAAMAQPPQ